MSTEHIAQTARKNYLTRLAPDQDNPAVQWHKCTVLFNILYTCKGLRQITNAQLRVLSISETGLCATSRRDDISDHFYINIGEDQLHIACAIIDRKGPVMHIRFLQDLPAVFVNVVASLEDPFVFMEKIRPALYGLEGYAQ